MAKRASTERKPGSTERVPTADEWAKAEQRAKGRQRTCGYCGQPGHILRTCPQYLKRFR